MASSAATWRCWPAAAVMRRMNYAVDAKRQDPAAVVTAFLDALDRGV
ncbi:MAG: hypothetical protein HYX77_00920 [Acidobacteria bacterium]|nr:hypothetical protein [Acidobacteriota bacterium]